MAENISDLSILVLSVKRPIVALVGNCRRYFCTLFIPLQVSAIAPHAVCGQRWLECSVILITPTTERHIISMRDERRKISFHGQLVRTGRSLSSPYPSAKIKFFSSRSWWARGTERMHCSDALKSHRPGPWPTLASKNGDQREECVHLSCLATTLATSLACARRTWTELWVLVN